MFITLPKLFDSLSGGTIFGAAFFLLVFFAALTSSIPLMETIVSVLQDKLKWKRQTICLLVMGVALLMALPSTLGYGIWSEVTIFGYQILDFFDFFSNNLLMPIVALLTAVLIGWGREAEVCHRRSFSLWNIPSKKAILRDDYLHRSGLYGHYSALFVPLRPLI